MKISIIISTFNAEKYLEECLKSIINQTLKDWELIIIDGNSKDSTVSIIKRYERYISYFISEDDSGIYDAWNKGLSWAQGEWITFIGADDLFSDQNVLFNASKYLKEASISGINYCYGKIQHVQADTMELIDVLGEPWNRVKSRLKNNMHLAHCASFHNQILFKKHGHFNTSFKIAGDYEFLLREFINPNSHAIFMSDLVVAKMRIGGISGTLNARITVAQECDRARKINGITSFSWEIFLWKIRIRIYMIFTAIFGEKKALKMADLYRKMKGAKEKWTL